MMSMVEKSLERPQEVQESEYAFPYHYIPSMGSGAYSATRHWSWGFRYLGGIEVVLAALAEREFSSLIDVGCGDGRFLREVKARHPTADLLGVDYSERAIQLARALNPELRYQAGNILTGPPEGRFDIATLVEVLEHIPPAELREFLEAVSNLITENGVMILTVPHANKPVNAKHYQHFTSETLGATLAPHFAQIEIRPFDDIRSLVLRAAVRLLGGRGGSIVVTEPRLNAAFFRLYRNRYLFLDDEARCGRLTAVCHKR